MGTKEKPGKYDCYSNALPDEPMFVLLARDMDAPYLVASWAEQRRMLIEDGMRPSSDMAMVSEAFESAALMREWRAANNGKWRAPASTPGLQGLGVDGAGSSALIALARTAAGGGAWARMHKLIYRLSGALVEEGPDWSDEGLDQLRVDVANELPREMVPDWLLPYRRAPVSQAERL